MKYENGRGILPEELLREVQKYAAGKLLYIPSDGERLQWGESSGYKQYLQERNRELKARFRAGIPIEQLAEEYFLSPESIKKIVYRKEPKPLEYRCTLSSAKEYAQNGRLEEWIHAYLLSDGHNKEFSDGLKLFERRFLGPVTMPLSLFHRCAGPEETMIYRIHPGWFEKHVTELGEAILREPDMPPLIVHYLIEEGKDEGEFELNDGNHRFEACNRLGITEYPVIVWITEDAEYRQFMEKYGKYLK